MCDAPVGLSDVCLRTDPLSFPLPLVSWVIRLSSNCLTVLPRSRTRAHRRNSHRIPGSAPSGATLTTTARSSILAAKQQGLMEKRVKAALARPAVTTQPDRLTDALWAALLSIRSCLAAVALMCSNQVHALHKIRQTRLSLAGRSGCANKREVRRHLSGIVHGNSSIRLSDASISFLEASVPSSRVLTASLSSAARLYDSSASSALPIAYRMDPFKMCQPS
jgi:hypothetical protein|eukprot:COSAG01_NODE_2849_length_6977_cov_66.208200_6_plen_221_part_00